MAEAEFNESILLVDDEEDIRSLLLDLVSPFNVRILVARSGEECLDLLQKESVFIIISDYRMPGMDGIELCRRVRGVRPLLPFILLTAYADKDTAVAGLREGVSDILDKPGDINRIPELVKAALEERKRALDAERDELAALRDIFSAEAQDLFDDIDKLILRLEEAGDDVTVVDNLFRRAHTLKGSAGSIPGAERIAKTVHVYENLLTKIRKGEVSCGGGVVDLLLRGADVIRELIRAFSDRRESAVNEAEIIETLHEAVATNGMSIGAEVDKNAGTKTKSPGQETPVVQTVSTDSDSEDAVLVTNERIASFMELSGDIIVFKNTLQMFLRQVAETAATEQYSQICDDFDQTLGKLADHLQQHVMDLRKVELSKALAKFPRIMRDLSKELGKKFRFEMVGGKLGVDKTVAKSLAASLIHLLRNAADHGIESPEVRREAGKPEVGEIKLSCKQRGDFITIEIEDDGKGIDKSRVLNKAVEQGLVSAADARYLKDEEIYGFIFHAGLSTSEQVSKVSGRGVGMDVVKTEIDHLKGTIRIETEPGKGTRFILSIPVPKTVMVEEAILARSGETLLAIPLTSIKSITSQKDLKLNCVQGLQTCQFEGATVPIGTYLDFLSPVTHRETAANASSLVIVISHGLDRVGLKVDEVIEQQDAVIRPFDNVVTRIEGFKGTSILNSERIAYVIDAEQLVSIAHKHSLEDAA